MKRFEFSLEKLKEYREQILDSEKNALGILRRELAELQAEHDEILLTIDRKCDELMEGAGRGIMPVQGAAAQRFIIVKRQEAEEMLQTIARKETEIERQLAVVIAATKDVTITEKLKEKKLEEYHAAEIKEQETFIEEFVQNANGRKVSDIPQ
jgi:flagellar FliJ protein